MSELDEPLLSSFPTDAPAAAEEPPSTPSVVDGNSSNTAATHGDDARRVHGDNQPTLREAVAAASSITSVRSSTGGVRLFKHDTEGRGAQHVEVTK